MQNNIQKTLLTLVLFVVIGMIGGKHVDAVSYGGVVIFTGVTNTSLVNNPNANQVVIVGPNAPKPPQTTPNPNVPQVKGEETCKPYFTVWSSMTENPRGEHVRKLQLFLNEHEGESLPGSEFFGALTKRAVIRFQKKYAINPANGNQFNNTTKKLNQIYCAKLEEALNKSTSTPIINATNTVATTTQVTPSTTTASTTVTTTTTQNTSSSTVLTTQPKIQLIASTTNITLQNALDVNGDGRVSPIDALNVLNYLNSGGNSNDPLKQYLDVNHDGSITPADALLIINLLNANDNG